MPDNDRPGHDDQGDSRYYGPFGPPPDRDNLSDSADAERTAPLGIGSWSYGLIRDTGAILLDMVPDRRVADGVRRAIETEGDTLADLHLWRLGPGHLGAIVAVTTTQPTHGPDHYRRLLARFPALSHVTVEVQQAA